MKPSKYKVTLNGHVSVVYAFTEREATILAQSEAIKDARNYELVSIEEINPYF